MDLQRFAEKLEDLTDESLLSGISTKKASIEEHRQLINNPLLKCPDYYERDIRYQKGLIRFWEKEIVEMEASIQRRIDELERRGVKYGQ